MAKKLSKRTGSASVMTYRDEGYLPHALLNYLVRLGWSHKDQEIFSIDEMIKLFNTSSINNSASALNISKLKWINQYYLRHSDFDAIKDEIMWHYKRAGIKINNGPDVKQLLPIYAEKIHTLVELVEKTRFFFEDFESYNEVAFKKHIKPTSKPMLIALKNKLQDIKDPNWNDSDHLHSLIQATANEFQVGMAKIGMPLRIAITGSSQSPDIGLTLSWLGKEKVIQRLEKIIIIIS